MAEASVGASVVSDPPQADDVTPMSDSIPRPVTTAGDGVRLAPGVRLLGEMPSVSFEERQWLVERDGQFLQVSELLYRILEYADGTKTLAEIADSVTDATEWMVDEKVLERLITTKLLPLRLVTAAGMSSAVAKRSATASPLAVYMSMKVVSPKYIEPLTGVLQHLFAPVLLVPLLALAGVAHWWMYRTQDLGASLWYTLNTPGALLAIMGIIVVAGCIHELGHAAALRYGGGKVRGIGAGIYLIFPAFYTDVTDAYRLGRSARVRTDLGGIYFHLLCALVLIGLSRAGTTGLFSSEALLFTAFLINIEMLRQFIPFVRLDGYWLLADLTGIPDFFSQMGPFLRSVFRVRGRGVRLPNLRPAAKFVFGVYTLAVVPVLLFLLVLLAVHLPGFFAATRDALIKQREFLSADEAVSTWLLAVSQIVLLLTPLIGGVYVLVSTALSLVAAARPGSRRALNSNLAGAVVSAVLVAVALVVLPSQSKTQGPTTPEQAQAQTLDPRAHPERLLETARDAFAATSTLAAEFEGMLGADAYGGSLVLERPNLAHVSIKGKKNGLGEFLVVANQERVIVYFPEVKEYTRTAARPDGRNINAFVIDQVKMFFRPRTLTANPQGTRVQYVGTELSDGKETDVVDVIPPGDSPTLTRYFVSRSDHLVHRIVRYSPERGVEEPNSWITLKNVKTAGPVDRQRFAWTLPEGARPLQLDMPLPVPGGSAAQ